MNCEMVLQGLSSNLNWSILQHQCEDAVAQLRAAKTRSTSSYHLEIFALLSLLHHLLFSLNHTTTMVEQKHMGKRCVYLLVASLSLPRLLALFLVKDPFVYTACKLC